MATFPKNHNGLYFDVLIRTQKAESLLSLIHATYHAKKAARKGGDVKADIAKRLQYSYGLFKDNVKGYDNGVGSYSGNEDQFSSQYTFGHEMAIWTNSNLDLNPLATQVAQNLITIRDYLDIVLLNYVQPISEVCVHPLHAILTYMQKRGVTKITRDDMADAIPGESVGENINALFQILISTNYFQTNADKELCYISKHPIADLIDCCNLTYIGADGYSKALEELNETAYNAYIITDNRCKTDTEDDDIVAKIKSGDIFSGFKPWLTSKYNPKYTGVQKYAYYVRSLQLLLTFMKEQDLIEDDNLNDLDVDKFNSIIEVYKISDKAKEYDYSMKRGAGIAALRLYVHYINFLISQMAITSDSPFAKGNGINKIFYGVPGCGKSYHIQHEILDAEKYEDKNVVRTTFYQDYSNTDFVGQILPKIKKDEDGKDIVEYIFNPGPFTLALIQAISNPTKKVALVIEEINRGNAPAIFGDIFQLLDRNEDGISEYGIKNVSLLDYLNTHDFDVDGKKKRYLFEEIKIPGNLSIYATMNTSDQNVYTLDTAFTRRWEKERIPNELTGKDAIEKLLVPGMEQYTWGQFVKAINDQIADKLDDLQVNEDKQVGRFFVKKTDLLEPNNTLDEKAKTKKATAFAHKVLEYLWDDVTKLDHSVIFNPGYKTFQQVVEDYLKDGVGVFNSNLFKD